MYVCEVILLLVELLQGCRSVEAEKSGCVARITDVHHWIGLGARFLESTALGSCLCVCVARLEVLSRLQVLQLELAVRHPQLLVLAVVLHV